MWRIGEELYSQFIKEATNLYVDSLDKNLENPVSLIRMYSLVGRIRLISSDTVLVAAEKVADSICRFLPTSSGNI